MSWGKWPKPIGDNLFCGFASFFMLLSVSSLGLADSSGTAVDLRAQKLAEHLNLKEREVETFDILIYLSSQTDFNELKEFEHKVYKGRAVHQILRQQAMDSQAQLLRFLTREKIPFQSFYIANVVAAFAVSKDQLLKIATLESVARIRPNFPFQVHKPLTRQMLQSEFQPGVGANIVHTGASQAWEEFSRGEGIVIAAQDTGIAFTHPALIAKYRGNSGEQIDHDYNWFDAIQEPISGGSNRCGRPSAVPCDDHGHGTHTLGTIIGDDSAANQIGMAPGAKWIGCRNMDNGVGRASTYIACFQFFLAPWPVGGDPQSDGDPDKSAHIISNSWSCPRGEGCTGDEFVEVLQALKAAGIMVVVAAGNSGSSCGTLKEPPAYHSELVFSVGAISHVSGNIAGFSSRGPSSYDDGIGPHITAPGVNIRSAIPGGGYAGSSWSGTSMATPHVAGAVALLWSSFPDLIGDIESTMSIFFASASAKRSNQICGGVSGEETPNNTYGYGALNVYQGLLDVRRSRTSG
jgi:subtilisin family serine protease